VLSVVLADTSERLSVLQARVFKDNRTEDEGLHYKSRGIFLCQQLGI